MYLSFTIEGILKSFILQEKLSFYKNNKDMQYLENFVIFSSAFGDIIILLSLIIGLICLDILGSKNYFNSLSNHGIFYLFNIFVIIMASTNNLLIMFFCFEFIFLPTIFFAYKFGYSKKIDKATIILFMWTLFGSFLVLCGLLYLYYKYNTLNYLLLSEKKISILEKKLLFYVFLVGFSIKIPLAPLHYWLLKVHVESPTAYSIFLSGFLVKSSLYCLSMLLQQFYASTESVPALIWFLYSLIVGTLGMARQTDIKKLIAWATVQEMTFMLLFLVFKQIFLTHTCILFIILHGLMSSYMFYIVDMLQRRFKTRALIYIKGLHLLLPKMTKHIWFLILLFSGFPLTAKFFIEWSLISLMVETQYSTLIYIILFVNFLGAIFFCKIMFTIIYGSQEEENLEFVETQKKEYGLLNFLVSFIIILLWLIYIL